MFIVESILNWFSKKTAQTNDYDLQCAQIQDCNVYVCDKVLIDSGFYESDDMKKPLCVCASLYDGKGQETYIVCNKAIVAPDVDLDIQNFLYWHENGHGAYNHLKVLEISYSSKFMCNQFNMILEITADLYGYTVTPDRPGFLRGMRKYGDSIENENEMTIRFMTERINMVKNLIGVYARVN